MRMHFTVRHNTLQQRLVVNYQALGYFFTTFDHFKMSSQVRTTFMYQQSETKTNGYL